MLATLVRVLVVETTLVTNCGHTGAAGMPVLTIKAFTVVLKINNPVAGKMMAFCWPVVRRGARNPLVVLPTSSIALVSGILPSALIETFWAKSREEVKKVTTKI